MLSRVFLGPVAVRRRAALVAVCLLLVSAESSDGDEASALRTRQLGAGEFAAAIRDASHLSPVERDAALQQIAAAQAAVGAETAALATVADIRDDARRGDILRQVASSDFQSRAGTPGPGGAVGGGVQPDFETLMELLKSTIAPDTWRDSGGTQGEVRPHAGGVFIDAGGAMRPIVDAAETARLGTLRREAARANEYRSVRRTSALRKVSLTRLQRELELRAFERRPIDDELRTLAGLQRVQYVFALPETGEVVIAGPAGDWYQGRENRLLAVENDRPVLRLEDLLTLLRREFAAGDPFGCSIDPTPEGLERLQSFVAQSARRPLAPGTRPQWTAELGKHLGDQRISVFGVDPTSRAARVLVEADYRMKLIGIGKEEGAAGVPDYFEIVKQSPRQPAGTMSLLRWWFTADYSALLTTPERDVFELRGPGVRLLSENEFLADRGQRVAAGQADRPNAEFAERFTKHLDALATKYPIYAELRNICDLALVSAVVRREQLDRRAEWRIASLLDADVPPQESVAAPTTVASVVNSVELSKTVVMAAVSGGVKIDLRAASDPASMEIDRRGVLSKVRRSATSGPVVPRGWWWD